MSINFLLILFVLVVVAMIAFILVQKGAGATAGSAFGSGASSTVFGAKGSGNFLTKTTMILAFLFFAISMLMAVQARKEFTAATTGEVDLGVIGKLDTNTTDVPTLAPAKDDATQQSDVPTIEVKTDATTSDVPAVDTVSDVVKKVTDTDVDTLKDAATQKLDEVKDTAIDKVEGLKQEAVKKVEEVKDSIDG